MWIRSFLDSTMNSVPCYAIAQALRLKSMPGRHAMISRMITRELMCKIFMKMKWWPLRESNSDAREGTGF